MREMQKQINRRFDGLAQSIAKNSLAAATESAPDSLPKLPSENIRTDEARVEDDGESLPLQDSSGASTTQQNATNEKEQEESEAPLSSEQLKV